MYDVPRILNSLFSRVGWKQPTQTEYAILTEENLTTKSGRYFQNTHAAVTIENIKESQQDEDISDPDFNEMLVYFQKSAILRTMSAIFIEPDVIETVMTFDRDTNIADTFQENQGNFVGYRIEIGATPDFATALSSVALYFDKDVTFELKCFVDNSDQAIWTKEVMAIGGETTIVDIDDLILSYMGKVSRTTTFYIGYFQDDLGEARAVNERIRAWRYGCLWNAESFAAQAVGTKFELPVTGTSYTQGLNLQLTSYRDHTNRIIANRALFDEAVSLQVACSVLELILSSTRSNATQRISQEKLADIFVALNQDIPTSDRPYGPGLKVRYQREIEKIHKAMLGQPRIESHSLPYAVYESRQLWD